MGNLLFSPSGRISPSLYMKGMVVLAVVSSILQLLPMISPALGVLGIIGFVVLYCFFALSIKRAHDGGKSGWMSIVYFIISIVVSIIITVVIFTVFGLNFMDVISLAMSGDVEALESFTQKSIIPSALANLIVYPATAFVVNAMTKQDQHDNTFGPYGSTADTFS